MTGAMPTLFVVDLTQAALASKPLSIIQSFKQAINQSINHSAHAATHRPQNGCHRGGVPTGRNSKLVTLACPACHVFVPLSAFLGFCGFFWCF